MSILGYFQPRSVELRMPKTADSLGIRFEGPVLTGEKSVQQQQQDEALRAVNGPAEPYRGIPHLVQAPSLFTGRRGLRRHPSR